MKKKIKDLTLEECRKICDKQDEIEECGENCPLAFYCEQNLFDIIRGKENSIPILESEVEVDE